MTDQSEREPGPIQKADVYKSGVLAATLTRESDGVHFAYTSDYLAGGGDAVATTLPLTDQPVITPAGAVPAFFAGLLPEGRRLPALRRQVKTSADDELSLIVAVGLDTIGDVQVVRDGFVPARGDSSSPTVQDPATLRFQDLLADSGLVDGVGLPGVQDKVSGKTIAVPVKHRGKDTILKLSPPEYPFLVENEAFFLTLARETGMSVVDHSILVDRDGVTGLLVSRFDRQRGDEPFAVPVEDGCQVQGLWPADKYNTSMASVVSSLAGLCAAKAPALQNAFRQVAFAVLTGNGDLHAKNMSVLYRGGEWFITPAYDLTSTLPYGDTSLALSVGGRKRDISRPALLDFAEGVGLRRQSAQKVLDTLLEKTAGVEERIRDGALPFDTDRIRQTTASIRQRRRLLTHDS